jgi:hypothetical protein
MMLFIKTRIAAIPALSFQKQPEVGIISLSRSALSTTLSERDE